VLALESINPTSQPGVIDGGGAIYAALQAEGEDVTLLVVPDFDQFPCLSTLTDAAENIWVATGTFPYSYRLSQAEGDLLAGLAATGRNIYLEGADHWGSGHIDSLLDGRDGVEPDLFDNIEDGDDSLTSVQSLDSGLVAGDFSSFGTVGYSQDNPIANDRTDRLILSGTDTTGSIPADANITAGAVWVNQDDTMTGEPRYIVGVAAEHSDGGRMISSSFEFGGFVGDPQQLISAYLDFFAGVTSEPTFTRGDSNGDSTVNIADAIFLLGNLFPVGPPNVLTCLEASDGNNDGTVNIADVISILDALFGVPPVPLAAPYPNCGSASDAPMQTGIGCAQSTCP
jgi:hypothetical protein